MLIFIIRTLLVYINRYIYIGIYIVYIINLYYTRIVHSSTHTHTYSVHMIWLYVLYKIRIYYKCISIIFIFFLHHVKFEMFSLKSRKMSHTSHTKRNHVQITLHQTKTYLLGFSV